MPATRRRRVARQQPRRRQRHAHRQRHRIAGRHAELGREILARAGCRGSSPSGVFSASRLPLVIAPFQVGHLLLERADRSL